MLDDHAGRLVEVARDRARRVEVDDVVERQLLAVVLLDSRQDVRAGAHLGVVRGALVRVLAVGQVGDLLVGANVQRREVLGLLGEPARDRGVVARGVGERLRGERLARWHRELGARRAQLVEHGVVGLGARDDRRERVVLRRGADHRRAADVDVLDDLGCGQAAGHGALERIEVHADEVDVLDVVLGGGVDVGLLVADRQQARVQARVQGLDAPVHHLRKAGEVLDRADLEAALGERGGGAAGRHELDAEVGQATGEVDDPALVGDRQQRAPDLDGRGGGERLGAVGVGLAGDGRDAIGRGNEPGAASPSLALLLAVRQHVAAVGDDRVRARAAVDRVLAAADGDDPVVARPALDDVVAEAAVEAVVAGAAVDEVLPAAALDRVAPALAEQQVVAAAPVQAVVAGSAVELVVAAVALEAVVAAEAIEPAVGVERALLAHAERVVAVRRPAVPRNRLVGVVVVDVGDGAGAGLARALQARVRRDAGLLARVDELGVQRAGG